MRRYPLKLSGWAAISRPLCGRLSYYSHCNVALSERRYPPVSTLRPLIPRRWHSSFQNEQSSTIYALSTAPGRAAIAIVRISGPACTQVYHALCPGHKLPKPRLASLRTLFDPIKPPSSHSVLDSGALILWFPGPKTVTGEDVLEMHIHGGPAVIKAVLGAIPKSIPSLGLETSIRYAEPGEFTRRAFLNDRLDLPQIEALGSTLAADTEQQRRLAVRGTSDSLSTRYEQWRQQLLHARGELEALIDFSEDQHFDESVGDFVSSISAQVEKLLRQINLHIENASKGELLRNGIKIALLGAPNAGKSSLLNRIVGREAAIVSSEEGTTRDIVDVGVDIGGWFCKFGDMAGLRSEPRGMTNSFELGPSPIGAIEKEGIRRAKARALESDVVIAVLSLEGNADSSKAQLTIEPEVADAVRSCLLQKKNVIVALNKADKASNELDSLRQYYAKQIGDIIPGVGPEQVFLISCKEAVQMSPELRDPGNMQTLLGGLIQTFERMANPSGLEMEKGQFDLSYWEDSLGVTHRQSSNLQTCVQHLNDFLSQVTQTPENAQRSITEMDETDIDIVTAAENLRFAADCLAKITGRSESGDVEQVLGVVFEKFCVGK